MSLESVNLFIIAIAAVVDVVIELVWFSPTVLGNEWNKTNQTYKKNTENLHNAKSDSLLSKYILSYIIAYVLAHFVNFIGAVTIQEAVRLGFWVWFGFVASIQLSDLFRTKGTMKLFYINSGYRLLSLVAMSIILTRWG